MVRIIFAVLLSFSPVMLHAAIFVDPVAKVQRGMLLVEEKLQSLRLFMIVKELQANYKAAVMTYQMAKAGYERAVNPKEWNALGKYAKYRMKALSEETNSPTQSSLFRAVLALDSAADSYIASSKVYMAAERGFSQTGRRVDQFDAAVAPKLEVVTGLDAIEATENKAVMNDYQWRKAKEQMLLAQATQSRIESETLKFKSKAEKSAEELDSLNKVERFAQEDKAKALEDYSTAKNEEDRKKADTRLKRVEGILAQVSSDSNRVQKYMEGLTTEAKELTSKIEKEKSMLELAAASLGLQQLGAHVLSAAGLSRMGQKDVWVDEIGKVTFYILLISMTLSILWKGYETVIHNQTTDIGRDVVIGLIAAMVFLTPGSPLYIRNLAEFIAVVTDTLEKTAFDNAINNSFGSIFQHFQKGWENMTGYKAGMKESLLSFNPITITADAVFGGVGMLTAQLFSGLAQVANYLGVLALIITMNLRTIFFWVLMIIAPLLIALAPLKWARRSVLRTWGTSLYAVLMWGFIAKTFLIFNVNLAQDNMDVVAQISQGGTGLSVLMGALQGILTACLMIMAPIITFYLAHGSFDGMVMASGGAIGAVAQGTLRAGYVAGIHGSAAGGRLFARTGQWAGGLSGMNRFGGGFGRLSTMATSAGNFLNGVSRNLAARHTR